jgi:type II secretory ATPase GspE/PulE/Tfp pilus assembly ATPase PilB-like protein
VQTGERVIVQFDGAGVPIESLEAAGMRPKMLEQFKEALRGSSGLALISAMPSGGLTTTLNLAMQSLDRYMRDFYIVEDKDKPEPEVENVQHVPYDVAGGQTPFEVLPGLFHKDPDVIVVPNLADAKTASALCEQAIEDSVVISTIRAKEAAEALLRVLMLKIPADQLAPVASAVLNVRLIRKLCEDCRQPYAPSPEMLKKLGIPAGRVQAFYRPPPAPEDPKEICASCRGVGYHGRTGIFELLIVNDQLREALIKQPKLEVLRKVARAAGHRGLQEEGLVMVAKGVTSLQELQRVLKQ